MKSSFESMWQSSCILLRIRLPWLLPISASHGFSPSPIPHPPLPLLLTGSSSIQLAVVDSLTYNKEVSSLSLS